MGVVLRGHTMNRRGKSVTTQLICIANYFRFQGVVLSFHLYDKLRECKSAYTKKPCILWTSSESPLEIQGVGSASFMLTAPVLSLWGKLFILGTHNNARHLLIIIHDCRVCHLHTRTARISRGRNCDAGQWSILGILIIPLWRSGFLSVFPSVSSYLSMSQFVLHAN